MTVAVLLPVRGDPRRVRARRTIPMPGHPDVMSGRSIPKTAHPDKVRSGAIALDDHLMAGRRGRGINADVDGEVTEEGGRRNAVRRDGGKGDKGEATGEP
jgi:hypothetical protein